MPECLNMMLLAVITSSDFIHSLHILSFYNPVKMHFRLTHWSKAWLLEANRCQGSKRVPVVTAWQSTTHSLWIIHEILHKVLYLATRPGRFPFGNAAHMMFASEQIYYCWLLFCTYRCNSERDLRVFGQERTEPTFIVFFLIPGSCNKTSGEFYSVPLSETPFTAAEQWGLMLR